MLSSYNELAITLNGYQAPRYEAIMTEHVKLWHRSQTTFTQELHKEQILWSRGGEVKLKIYRSMLLCLCLISFRGDYPVTSSTTVPAISVTDAPLSVPGVLSAI
jgi:hypothetical protein